MTKGDLMRKVYSKEELRNIDSAIPMEYWKEIDTWRHVMNYNGPNCRVFGKLEDMLEVAYTRGIDLGELLIRCNECYWIGFEEDLDTRGDMAEHCPKCGADHALMNQQIAKDTDKPLSALGYSKFIIHLEHDNGTVRIANVNTDIKRAIGAVLKSEGAPLSAIFRIDIEPLNR